MKKKYKISISKGVSLTLIVIIIAIASFFSPKTIPPRKIMVRDMSVTDTTISIEVDDIADSAIGYSGYQTRYDNGTLFIKIKGGLIGSKPWFADISIDKSSYGKINKIYLQGDNSSENVQIWPDVQ